MDVSPFILLWKRRSGATSTSTPNVSDKKEKSYLCMKKCEYELIWLPHSIKATNAAVICMAPRLRASFRNLLRAGMKMKMNSMAGKKTLIKIITM